jgi:hypothetical protein
MMRDDAPPKCPRCEKPLRRTGERLRPGREPDDADYVAAILYRCDGCRLRWTDPMDGTFLQLMGAAKKREERSPKIERNDG